MYPGDRKILELLSQEGVYELLTQYDNQKLIRFEPHRVS